MSTLVEESKAILEALQAKAKAQAEEKIRKETAERLDAEPVRRPRVFGAPSLSRVVSREPLVGPCCCPLFLCSIFTMQ